MVKILEESAVFGKIRERVDNIVYFYRDLSALITCIFYIIFINNSIHKKYFIILMVFIASVTLNYLYYNCRNCKKNISTLLIVETVYISVIITITGGLNSPFIWYTFNSIIVSFMLLNNSKYSVLCLCTYLASGTFVPYIISFKYNIISGYATFNYNNALCIILITGLVYALSKCTNALNKKNNELKSANEQIKESINNLIDLYNTMHIFTVQNNKDEIIQQIMKYCSLIFNTNNVIFFTNNKEKEGEDYIFSYKNLSCKTDPQLVKYIKNNYFSDCCKKNITSFTVNEKIYLFCPIKYNCNIFGILTIETQNSENNIFDSLSFIAELSSIVLQKFELEKINDDLLINEEQNRIANEIHDGVLQRLFSTSCCAYTLIKNIENYDNNKIKHELNLIRNSINNSMTDLRRTIYKLSLNKFGNNLFITDIEKYIDEVQELNDVSISFEFIGDSELLSIEYKKSIYRIICELISNSIRHGNAKNIEIKFTILKNNISLFIKDDGIGFNYEEVMRGGKHGMGLKNMYHLVNLLCGSIEINSLENTGTQITILITLAASININQNIIQEEKSIYDDISN